MLLSSARFGSLLLISLLPGFRFAELLAFRSVKRSLATNLRAFCHGGRSQSLIVARVPNAVVRISQLSDHPCDECTIFRQRQPSQHLHRTYDTQ